MKTPRPCFHPSSCKAGWPSGSTVTTTVSAVTQRSAISARSTTSRSTSLPVHSPPRGPDHCPRNRGNLRELTVGEGDVVTGGEERDQANNSANKGFQQGFAIEPQPPPGQRRIQMPRIFIHPKQPNPIPITTSPIRAYASTHA